MASSPAEIVRACLIDQEVALLAIIEDQTILYQQTPGDGSTPCYVSSMPDEIDQAVLIKDVPGLQFGRRQDDGKYLSHYGIKILIRALDNPTARDLAYAICTALGEINRTTTVTPDGETHYLQSVYLTTQLVDMGEETGRKRQLWSINARVAFQDQEPTVG